MRRSRRSTPIGRPSRRALLRPLLLLGSVLGLALVGSTLGSAVRAPRPGRVVYGLSWRWGRALPGSGGWTTESDRGYQVTLEQGYLVSHGAALVACAAEQLGPWDRLLDRRLLGSLPMPRAVHAGHTGIDREPSQLDHPTVEDLVRAENLELGTIDVRSPAPAYCQGHYAIGLAAADAARMPLPAALAGGSLFVSGAYRQGLGASRPFEIQSELAWGAVGPLLAPEDAAAASPSEAGSKGPVAQRAELDGGDLRLDIERELGSLFDGLDFEHASSDQMAKALLQNLADSTRFELRDPVGQASARRGR